MEDVINRNTRWTVPQRQNLTCCDLLKKDEYVECFSFAAYLITLDKLNFEYNAYMYLDSLGFLSGLTVMCFALKDKRNNFPVVAVLRFFFSLIILSLAISPSTGYLSLYYFPPSKFKEKVTFKLFAYHHFFSVFLKLSQGVS